MDDQILQGLVASKLGDANAAAGQAAAQPAQSPDIQQAPAPAAEAAPAAQDMSAAMPQGQPAPQQQNEPNQTAMEAAVQAVSPTDESRMESFTVDFGDGNMRELTPSQIKSTFQRYSALNHKHQTKFKNAEPVVDFVNQVIEEAAKTGAQLSPQDVLAFLTQGGHQQNVQGANLGHNTYGQAGVNDGEDDPLAQWERENAVTLPPGLRESYAKSQMLEGELIKTQEMMAQILAAAQGVGQQSQQQAMTADQQHRMALKNTIVNNLSSAQAQLGLSDGDEQDFMQFAFSRGYTVEDFIDPQLTVAVATDFRNNKNSPEMDRLRSMAQRRQAFTGNVQGAPAGPAGGAPTGGDDKSFMDSMIGNAMNNKFRG